MLTHGGADLVIERLAELPEVELAGIFIETSAPASRSLTEKLRRSLKYDGVAATARKFLRLNRRGNGAVAPDRTRDAAKERKIPVYEVVDLHSEDAIDLLGSADADLAVIFGTNIIKESVFSIPKLGSINLHQGLAPFYRGGPPVFWELFNGETEIGLTVHFVASKVDTGDIVLQRSFPLEYDEKFGLEFEDFINEYRAGLRDASAAMVAEAVGAIAAGHFDRIPQDTTLGTRYRLPTKKEKDEMRRRLKNRFFSKEDH